MRRRVGLVAVVLLLLGWLTAVLAGALHDGEVPRVPERKEPRGRQTPVVAPEARSATVEPASSAPAPSQAPCSGCGEVVLRDLATGEPASGVAVAFDHPSTPGMEARCGCPTEVRSDEGGVVRWPGHARLRTIEEPWRSTSLDAPAGAHPEVWVYRSARLRGVVESDAAGRKLNAARVSLSLSAAGSGWGDGPIPSRPGSPEWLAAHGVGRSPWKVGHPDPTGRFEVSVPLVAGLRIVADAPGWRAANVDVASVAEGGEAVLRLAPAVRIRGRLVGPDGRPLVGARVVARTTVTADYETIDPAKLALLQPGGAFSGSRNPTTGKARASFSSWCSTDADGQFELALKTDGDVRVIAYAVGHGYVQARLGRTSGDVEDVRIVAPPSSGTATITLRYGDQLLRDATVMRNEILEVDQETVTYHCDAEGRIDASWFVPGHTYALIPVSTGAVSVPGAWFYVTWTGEADLDLKSLSTESPR